MDKLPTLHPLVRVISLIIAATAIALGDGFVIFSGALLLLLVYVRLGFHHLRAAWPMIRRLRWFFLSIVVLYGLFGSAAAGGLHLSWGGVGAGLTRVAALMVIAAAVTLLLQTTSRDDLFKAIYLLASVLPTGSAVRARLALRITLTLDALEQVRAAWETRRPPLSDQPKASFRQRMRHWSTSASAMLEYVIGRAGRAEQRQMTLAEVSAPPPWQWLVPLSLVGLFLVIY